MLECSPCSPTPSTDTPVPQFSNCTNTHKLFSCPSRPSSADDFKTAQKPNVGCRFYVVHFSVFTATRGGDLLITQPASKQLKSNIKILPSYVVPTKYLKWREGRTWVKESERWRGRESKRERQRWREKVQRERESERNSPGCCCGVTPQIGSMIALITLLLSPCQADGDAENRA